MEELLLTLGGLTLGGSAAAAALFLAGRSTRARYGARWRCWAWLLLCLRLAVPLPLLPRGETRAPIQVDLPAAVRPVPPEAGPDTPVLPAFPPEGNTSPVSPEDSGNHSLPPIPEPSAPEEEASPRPSLSPARAAVGLWLLGAAAVLAWSVISHLRFLTYLRRWSAPPRDGQVTATFHRIGDQLGLRRLPRLLVCQGLKVPMLSGVLRPALLLPQGAGWTGEELSCSLLHELTHYRRRDIWLKTLAMWVSALHWFNPLMWYMVRMVERDTELACDEDVLRRLPPESRAVYGQTILTAVERLQK